MSPKYPKRAVGWFSVVGLMGPLALVAAVPQEPSPMPSPAPTTAAPSGPPTVLLLTNGQVRIGEILKDQSGYFVKQTFGTSHYPRRNVEHTFRSLNEAYEYKKARRPEQDPDERMRLASWCLEQKLIDEAKAELAEIVKVYPEHRQAATILATLERQQAEPDETVDEGVVRTGMTAEAIAPGEAILQRYREEYARNPRPSGMPVIFDLDVPLAVRRYSEFARSIHPMLQRRCARCHNENTPGEFQMTQTRGQRDLTNDLIIRANLDSTLRIIDPDDLSRSPILTAAGMTHGNGGKPVLGGPNSPEYVALATWVTSLKKASQAPATPSGSETSPPTEGFATGRFPKTVDPAQPPPPARTPSGSPILPRTPLDLAPDRTTVTTRDMQADIVPVPAGSLIPGSTNGLPQNPPPPAEFVPPQTIEVGGRTVPIAPQAGTGKPVAEPELGAGMIRLPNGEVGSKTPTGEVVPLVRMDNGNYGMRLPTGEIAPIMTKAETKKADDEAKKTPKIDAKKLESFLKARPKS